MGPVAIRADSLSKRFRIGRRADADDHIWALRDVSFEVAQGEVLGVIGRNGAGKSTLLKILSRITAPTSGEARVRGRVGSLLEVGTGFHPELTGRENVYLNGAILGMKKARIDAVFDEIVAFSEVERFLDTPVKRYSSGMRVRLAFAVASHLEPEILIVDEVLAVGDAAFQQKCLGRMQNVAGHGRTVLFVSHNMASVSRLCHRGIVLEGGVLRFDGDVDTAVARYLDNETRDEGDVVDLSRAGGWDEQRDPQLQWVSTHRADGTPTRDFDTGGPLVLRIGYELDGPISSGYCQINFFDRSGNRVMSVDTDHGRQALAFDRKGVVECRLDHVRLAEGEYRVDLEIGSSFPSRRWLDYVPSATRVRVRLGDYLGGGELRPGQGVVAQRSAWSLL